MSIGRVPGATGIQPSIVTAKGDLIVATASGSVTNQAVGSNNQVLTADSAQADGVKWANGSAATLTTTGDLLYASAANTPARLGIGSTDQVLKVSGGVPVWGSAGSTTQGVSVWKNGVMSLTSGAYTTFTFDQEYYDTDGFHSTTTNTSRLTVPTGLGGKYCISFNFKCGTSSAAEFIPRILVNGNAANDYNGKTTGNSEARFFTGVLAWNLSAGDYVEVAVYHAFGSSVNAEVDNGRGHFQMFRIGA